MDTREQTKKSAIPKLESPAKPAACPACGRENPPDAVFCENPRCHKALGEFKYVKEELLREARWYESAAARVIRFVGSPHFLSAHFFWFVMWLGINLGAIPLVRRFDPYPFELLGIILSIETIFITGFVLISNNRLSEYAEKRAALDYEVSVRTYREIGRTAAMLENAGRRLENQEDR